MVGQASKPAIEKYLLFSTWTVERALSIVKPPLHLSKVRPPMHLSKVKQPTHLRKPMPTVQLRKEMGNIRRISIM